MVKTDVKAPDQTLTISAPIADCSKSLAPNPNFAPQAITAGKAAVVADSFAAVFTNSKPKECPVSTCRLMNAGCSTLWTQEFFAVVNNAPFAISATANAPPKSHGLCYLCEVAKSDTSTGGTFTKEMTLTVRAPIADCSKSLAPNPNFAPQAITAGKAAVVADSFAAVFTNSKPKECPVSTCRLMNAGCSTLWTQEFFAVVNNAPFAISATANAPPKSHGLCYLCEVAKSDTSTGGTFTKEMTLSVKTSVTSDGTSTD